MSDDPRSAAAGLSPQDQHKPQDEQGNKSCASEEPEHCAAIDQRTAARTAEVAVAPRVHAPAELSPERKGLDWPALKSWLVRRRVILVSLAFVSIAFALAARQAPRAALLAGESFADVVFSARIIAIRQIPGQGQRALLCQAQGGPCKTLNQDSQVEAGFLVRTGPEARVDLVLNDRSKIWLNRATELVFDAKGSRRLALQSGEAVFEFVRGNPAHIDLGYGEVRAQSAKFLIKRGSALANVEVIRGQLRLHDERGRELTLEAGEVGSLGREQAPTQHFAGRFGEDFAFSESEELATQNGADSPGLAGLGELRARKPGSVEELSDAVKLTRHHIKVRISANVARTEIEEVFANGTDQVLEGIYRFPLPPDAQIERLALEVDGRWEEGAFVERERAAAIWRGAIVNAAPSKPRPVEEIVWVPGPWRDPALLEWQRGGRFELRIYPIPKRGARRLILAYTQVVARDGESRRYTYPLPYDQHGALKVDDFSIDVQIRGHDAERGVEAHGYNLERDPRAAGLERLRLTQRGFLPAGDLSLEYRLEHSARPLQGFTYRAQNAAEAPTSSPSAPFANEASGKPRADLGTYAALELVPELPRTAEWPARNVVFLVDASRSMIGERFARARRVVARTVLELDPRDQFKVLVCDIECRALAEHFAAPGVEAAALTDKALARITPEGASDLAATVSAGVLAGRADTTRKLHLVYVGDGTPTVGAVTPGFIQREVEASLSTFASNGSSAAVTAIAIGTDSDVSSLKALALRGTLVPYTPGAGVAEVAYAALGSIYGSRLSDVEVELPVGLVEQVPRRPDAISAGGSLLIAARMLTDTVEGDVILRGQFEGKPYERRFPLKLQADSSVGNAFVPRLFAALQIAELDRDTSASAKSRSIELSQKFSVASRHTSLLVLESEAMSRAFGLKHERAAPAWSGEDEIVANDEAAPADESRDDERYGLADEEQDSQLAEIGSSRGEGSGYAASAPAGAMAPAPARRAQNAAPSAEAADSRGPSKDLSKAKSPYAEPPASSGERKSAPKVASGALAPSELDDPLQIVREPVRRERMVPMRRIWERFGSVNTTRTIPAFAEDPKVRAAEEEFQRNPLNRSALRQLYRVYFVSGRLADAGRLAEEWSNKDPLDPEALTARADIAAERGDRELAIRILGSVVDVRPGDHKAQWRLARLFRWSEQAKAGCRFSFAVAQIRGNDAALFAEAARCLRDTQQEAVSAELLQSISAEMRATVQQLLAKPAPLHNALSGDFRLQARWDGAEDVDLVLIHPDGHRVSWLGAPTKSVISASNVRSLSEEGLALRGAEVGEYVLEITRSRGQSGTVRGAVNVTVAEQRQELPFELVGERVRLAIAKVGMRSKLVRL